MSIYGTDFVLADDELGDDDLAAGWIDPGAPFAYLGSHVLPGPEAPRAGEVQIASIPGFITRDGDPRSEADLEVAEDEGYQRLHPYLRLSVDAWDCRSDTGVYATVVLDAAQAAALRDALTRWLDTPKVDTGDWMPTQATNIQFRLAHPELFAKDLSAPPAEQ